MDCPGRYGVLGWVSIRDVYKRQVKDGKLILGLSGNPASAALGLHLLGLPFVKKLSGRGLVRPRKIRCTLLGPIRKSSPNGRLVRGSLEIVDGAAAFRPIDAQGNGALTSLLGCDLIGTLPPDMSISPHSRCNGKG